MNIFRNNIITNPKPLSIKDFENLKIDIKKKVRIDPHIFLIPDDPKIKNMLRKYFGFQ